MNPVGSQAPVGAATPTLDVKRAQLQALLLKKSLEAQQEQATEAQNEQEGRGRLVDIRV